MVLILEIANFLLKVYDRIERRKTKQRRRKPTKPRSAAPRMTRRSTKRR